MHLVRSGYSFRERKTVFTENFLNKTISEELFTSLMGKKNEEYLSFIAKMTDEEVLPDVPKTLDYLIENQQPISLGSASKNARPILEKVNLLKKFDAIVDGNDVSKAKPDPEVFLIAAKHLIMKPEDCIVFEDSVAGLIAAHRGGMLAVGIGEANVLSEADVVIKGFSDLDFDGLTAKLKLTKTL